MSRIPQLMMQMPRQSLLQVHPQFRNTRFATSPESHLGQGKQMLLGAHLFSCA